MDIVLSGVSSVILGVSLGMIYFGLLWLTVNAAASVRRPGLLFATSYGLRISLTLVVFYFMALTGVFELACCFLGFVVARTGVIDRAGRRREESDGDQP